MKAKSLAAGITTGILLATGSGIAAYAAPTTPPAVVM